MIRIFLHGATCCEPCSRLLATVDVDILGAYRFGSSFAVYAIPCCLLTFDRYLLFQGL